MTDATYDAAIIGGGVIGCSIALAMSRAGHRVVGLDKGPAAGAGSTSSSSAIIRFHYSTLDGVISSWESKHLWDRWDELIGGADDALARFYKVGMLIIDPPGDRRTKVLELFDTVGVPYLKMSSADIAGRYPGMDIGRYWPPRAVADEEFWGTAHGEVDAYLTPDAGFVDDPQLAAHNLMAAARVAGAEFRFRTQVDEIRQDADRVTGICLADGTTLSTPVVINAAGPYSQRVNIMAGVIDDFATIGTRPLRQEVHALPAPPDYQIPGDAPVMNDGDLGTYFRPHPGGTMIVGGLEPDCDPLVWIDDPDDYDPYPTVAGWEAQVLRTARRMRNLEVPSRPTGLAALYDVTPDWVPIYDRTSLPGFYVAIGTSGNQFKNAPLVGPIINALVEACEGGRDHDKDPVSLHCQVTGNNLDIGHYSRLRTPAQTTMSVLG